jgi:spore coat assembly protein SafA
MFQLIVVAAVLAASFASTGSVSASGCSRSYTVQWGDTMSGVALRYGTTAAGIQSANPGLGWWLYAGQVLCIPAGAYVEVPISQPASGGKYTVQKGDTLGKIAARMGVSLNSLIAVNPQIHNPSLIYPGQVINLPAGSHPPYNPTPQNPGTCIKCPPPSPGDGLSTLEIAYKHGMYIRSDPNGKVIASALNNDTIYYYPSSAFRVGGCTWVKVKVYPPTKGYYEGWLLVKDQLGKYFTSPQID